MSKLITGYRAVVAKALGDSISLPAFILLATMSGYGSLAESGGFSTAMAVVGTLLIWGLPGQLAMIELATQGQGLLAIVTACSLANARFMPMVVSFLPHINRPGTRLSSLLLLSQMLSINSWAVCLRGFPLVDVEWRRFYYVVFACSIALAAVVGTIVGTHAVGVLPRHIVLGLVFLSPLFFALVLASTPALSSRLSILLGCLTVPVAHYFFPTIDLLLSGFFAGTAGFLIARSKFFKRDEP
jgi:predicted branched-subunit amino acid permease